MYKYSSTINVYEMYTEVCKHNFYLEKSMKLLIYEYYFGVNVFCL